MREAFYRESEHRCLFFLFFLLRKRLTSCCCYFCCCSSSCCSSVRSGNLLLLRAVLGERHGPARSGAHRKREFERERASKERSSPLSLSLSKKKMSDLKEMSFEVMSMTHTLHTSIFPSFNSLPSFSLVLPCPSRGSATKAPAARRARHRPLSPSVNVADQESGGRSESSSRSIKHSIASIDRRGRLFFDLLHCRAFFFFPGPPPPRFHLRSRRRRLCFGEDDEVSHDPLC